jgi:hypothetical protein
MRDNCSLPGPRPVATEGGRAVGSEERGRGREAIRTAYRVMPEPAV